MPILLENHATRILMPKAKSNLNSMSSLAFCMDVVQDRAASKCRSVSYCVNPKYMMAVYPNAINSTYCIPMNLVHRRWRKRMGMLCGLFNKGDRLFIINVCVYSLKSITSYSAPLN